MSYVRRVESGVSISTWDQGLREMKKENGLVNANVTCKAVKTTNADPTVANVNVKMDIQEFVVMLTSQYVRFFFLFGLRMN